MKMAATGAGNGGAAGRRARRTHLGELHLPRHDDGEKARLLLRHLPLRVSAPRLRALFPGSASPSGGRHPRQLPSPGSCRRIRARSTESPRTRVRYALEARTRGSRRDATRGRSRGSNCAAGPRRAARKPSTRAFSPNVPNGRLSNDGRDDRGRAGGRRKIFFAAASRRGCQHNFDAIRRAQSPLLSPLGSLIITRARVYAPTHHPSLPPPSPFR